MTFAEPGTLIKERMQWAIGVAKRIATSPHSYKCRAVFIKAIVLAVAMYGTEASLVEQATLRSFQVAIVDALAQRSTLRFVDSVFSLDGFGTEIDLGVAQVASKHVVVRRVMCKLPQAGYMVDSILEHYDSLGYPACPPPGHPSRGYGSILTLRLVPLSFWLLPRGVSELLDNARTSSSSNTVRLICRFGRERINSLGWNC